MEHFGVKTVLVSFHRKIIKQQQYMLSITIVPWCAVLKPKMKTWGIW